MLETPRTYHQSALAVLQTKTAAGPEMNGFHHQQNQQHPNSKPAGPTTHGTTTECAFIPIEVTTSSSSQYLEIQGGNNSFIPTQPSITFFSASTAAFSSLIPCGNAHLIHSVIVITPGSELFLLQYLSMFSWSRRRRCRFLLGSTRTPQLQQGTQNTPEHLPTCSECLNLDDLCVFTPAQGTDWLFSGNHQLGGTIHLRN